MRCLLGLCLIWGYFGLVGAEPELVLNSPLSSLKGFSVRYPLDDSIGSHPAVIFSADFEEADLASGWDERRDRDGKVLSRVRLEDPDHPFGHSLRVTATLGQNTGGGLTQWFEPSESVFIRFYPRFADL